MSEKISVGLGLFGKNAIKSQMNGYQPFFMVDKISWEAMGKQAQRDLINEELTKRAIKWLYTEEEERAMKRWKEQLLKLKDFSASVYTKRELWNTLGRDSDFISIRTMIEGFLLEVDIV